ncbi:hypothetical protein P691DRAFT_796425 [Macrolepiota fuliginosa MF-IS2]|uniref:Heterokaryon incompatibility domain-containing protein n=1 Tax=Macrolepiota fuliginosa MF-IS2 TaxID=1400762 RepID=A0A9P5X708_9AGAR|nr:hypothetical protein P691DRAFT_796425 [Macrolepiota fuliginosa MF-IS2]
MPQNRCYPVLPFSQPRTPNLRNAWALFKTHVYPRRLIREDDGVRGPLWFGENATKHPELHIFANILRLLFAIVLAPGWMWLRPRTAADIRAWLTIYLWPQVWPQAPEDLLANCSMSSSGSHPPLPEKRMRGDECAAAAYEPRWLLQVQFRGDEILSQRQVRYDDGSGSVVQDKTNNTPRKRAQDVGYSAISYAASCAEKLLAESGATRAGTMKNNTANRKKVAQAMLKEYARARTSMNNNNKTDGIEFIWLDELCLSDDAATNEVEMEKQRNEELGRVADIFRSARRVVVFCHIAGCDHTTTDCPWGNRLFALPEVLNTSRIFKMTRTYESEKELVSSITSVSGQEFRECMRTRAAAARMWHLSNLLTPNGLTSQSDIHSLVVETIRRAEGDVSGKSHDFLGKALNGLLPRRAQLADLHGTNGWADLVWLLELNQGYYNTALLAAVSKLADPDTNGYRWLGKPIEPQEDRGRLTPLLTAIPATLHDRVTNATIPILSLTGAKTIELDHMLQRDSGGLERQPEMQALRSLGLLIWMFLIILGFILSAVIGGVGLLIFWVASILYVILQLLVGTIYVRKDTWVVIEDYRAPGHDAYRLLQSRDPSFTRAVEWGERQVAPKWDVPYSMEPRTSVPQARGGAHPYPVTLIDLSTGVAVRALVTARPNDIVTFAVHGNGVTCMLLDRDQDAQMATISVKVGMANLPPYVMAQSTHAGSVYIGGHAFREVRRPLRFFAWFARMMSNNNSDDIKTYLAKAAAENHEMQDIPPDFGSPLSKSVSIASTAPIVSSRSNPFMTYGNPSEATVAGEDLGSQKGEDDLDLPHPPRAAARFREMPNTQWFPERRNLEDTV